METLLLAEKQKSLPEWDLSDLIPSHEHHHLAKKFEFIKIKAQKFQTKYKKQLGKLNPTDLEKAISSYQEIEEELDGLLSYTFLAYAANTRDINIKSTFQNSQEKANDIKNYLLFFELEMNKMPEKKLLSHLKNNKFSPWLKNLTALRPYQLHEELEQLFLDKSAVSHTAWIKLYNDTLNDLHIKIDGKTIELKDALCDTRSPIEKTRKNASRAIGQALHKKSETFTTIYNSLIKDKLIEDKWRNFKNVDSSRNVNNFVEDEVITALSDSVQEYYSRLSHRFYKFKANQLNKKQLDTWDLSAPWLKEQGYISWHDAQNIILEAYHEFSPKMAEIGQKFFDNSWIDAPPKAGKMSGAFAHPTVPSAHPYLMVNYQGKIQDVMTLAHELGHGIHQYLASPHGHLMADTTINLAETASVFGEMLTFQALVKKQKKPDLKKQFLANKIQDMLSTVSRQISFYLFEKDIHNQRKQGELSYEKISEHWFIRQKECLGPYVKLEEYYGSYWCYISHFFEVPFYVYSYAFGDCLVNSLYSLYLSGHKNFEAKYLDLLAAGGTKRHDELVQPFGLNTKDKKFWEQGLCMIETFIDELES